jgi:hypothetical protein
MTAGKVSTFTIKIDSPFHCLLAFDTISKFITIFIIFISAIQVDYDLYFSDPTRSSASLVVPFFLGAKSSLTIAMWVQFTQKDEGGIFFSLYSVLYVENKMYFEPFSFLFQFLPSLFLVSFFLFFSFESKLNNNSF